MAETQEPKRYDKLPDGYELVKKEDFFDYAGIPKMGTHFIMQSFHDGHYQLFTINGNFDYEKIEVWVDADKAWMKGKKKEEQKKETPKDNRSLIDRVDMMF